MLSLFPSGLGDPGDAGDPGAGGNTGENSGDYGGVDSGNDRGPQAAYGGSAQAAQAAGVTAQALADAEAEAAREVARFDNARASAIASAQAAADAAKAASVAASAFQFGLSKTGIFGAVLGFIDKATGFSQAAFAALASGNTGAYNSNASAAADNLDRARGEALALNDPAVIAATDAAIAKHNLAISKVAKVISMTPDEQTFANEAKRIYSDQSTTLAQKQKAIADVFRSTRVSVDYAAAVFGIPREDVLTVLARYPASVTGASSLPVMAALAAAAYFFMGS